MSIPSAARSRLAACIVFFAGLALGGCAQSASAGSDAAGAAGSNPVGAGGAMPWPGAGGAPGGTGGSGGAAGAPGATTPGPNAFLHADVWSIWWNDRTRCGAERTFLDICQHQGGDCSLYQQAYSACNPTQIVYGQVGPEKQSESLCRQSVFPDIGGCIAANYDFAKLRFHWYGAEWEGNWPWATIKDFNQGDDYTGGGELVAISSLPGYAQAAMGGIQNHTLGHGCTMTGVTTGSDKFTRPFGGFAWVEVPAGKPVTIAVAASDNFGDHAFAGCQRGAATQSPWVTAAPGAVLGCVYVQENVVLEAGRHYFWQYGKLSELPTAAPPQVIVDGFAAPDVGIDVTQEQNCKL